MASLAAMLELLVRAAHPCRPDRELPSDWSTAQWKTFLELARFHGVSPLIAYYARSGEVSGMPDTIASMFLKDLHQNRLFHHAAMERLRGITEALTDADIPVTPLKGPSLSERLYPSAGLRPFEDLDLLIESADRRNAQRVLTRLGYVPSSGSLILPLLPAYHFHSQWIHPETRQCVEIHWRPADRGSLPRQRFPNRSFLEQIKACDEAYAAYLAVHLDKHGLLNTVIRRNGRDPLIALHPLNDVRLIWLLDFLLLSSSDSFDHDQLLTTADAWRVRPAVDNTCYLAALLSTETDPGKPAIHAASASARTPLWKRRLLTRLEADMQAPAAVPETPWWLKPGKRTGFRPVRFLDFL